MTGKSTCLSIITLNANGLNFPASRMAGWIKKKESDLVNFFTAFRNTSHQQRHTQTKIARMKTIFQANGI